MASSPTATIICPWCYAKLRAQVDDGSIDWQEVCDCPWTEEKPTDHGEFQLATVEEMVYEAWHEATVAYEPDDPPPSGNDESNLDNYHHFGPDE